MINLTNRKLISSCSSAVNGGNGNTNSFEGKGDCMGDTKLGGKSIKKE